MITVDIDLSQSLTLNTSCGLKNKCVELGIERRHQEKYCQTIRSLFADIEDSSYVMNVIHLCMAISHIDFICWNIYISLANMPHIMLLALME